LKAPPPGNQNFFALLQSFRCWSFLSGKVSILLSIKRIV
jgi:hypothetical protein